MSLSSICSPRQKQDLLTLGLTPDKFGKLPDADTIKKAYRTRVIQVHPDKQQQVSSPTTTSDAGASKKNNAAAAFLAVQEAYENLTSPQKLKEERSMNQSAAANQQFRAKSPTASSRGSGLFGAASSNQSHQRTRTPPTSSRPAFTSTKSPSSKFATASSSSSFQSASPFHQSNLGSTTNNNNSSSSSSSSTSTRRPASGSFSSATSPLSSSMTSRLSNSATRGVYFNRAPPPAPPSTSSTSSSQQRRRSSMMDTSGNKYSTSSASSSSPFSPRSAAPSSSTNTASSTSSNTFVVNSKTPNYQPGTALFPPPFKNNLMIKAPFPSFLPNGETYIFETDPWAFGIYSNHLRHGDTARISISLSSSSTGQQDDEGSSLFFEGVIIGVAADGNLYWWRLLSSNSHQANEKELDAFATFAGPTIPANAFQQANRLVVVKQPVPMMDPLSFSNNKDPYYSAAPSASTTTKSTPQHYYGSNNQNQNHQYASSSGASTPSSLGSSLNGTTSTSSSFCDGNIATLLRELVESEKSERERKMMIYSMWVGEQLWCWNMMFVALADSSRFSRTL